MSMSIALHGKSAEVFRVVNKVQPASDPNELFQMSAYPVVTIKTGTGYNSDDVTLFLSFNQIKILHEELSAFIQSKEFCEAAYLESEQYKQDLVDELEIVMENE